MVGEQGKMGSALMVGFFNISILIIVLSVVSGMTSVWAQSVKAYVDRNPVMADETFQLIVETDQAASGESPEWSILAADFDVLGTTQSQQTSIINMRTTSLVRWIVTLAPKRTGAVTIPPIAVGAHQSDPIQLTVNEPNHTREGNESQEIFLEADVDAHAPHLQGQVLLTLRLVSAISVQEGRLDEPEIDWGIVERVGKDASYESARNGRRYQITERRYVITPQESGAHVIPPILFTGIVQDGQMRGTLFEELFGNRSGSLGRDPFKTSRSIHRRSPKIVLTVKDLPPDLNGRFWLPAKALTLTETWSANTENLQIGASLTRTVVIRAKGQRGEQLPELTLPTQAIVKIYPDKAKTQTDFDGTWVLGSREEQYVLVPTQPGTVTLPAIHIPWWNIDTSRWEEARLPAKILTVLGTLQPASSAQIFSSVPVPSDAAVESDPHGMEASRPATFGAFDGAKTFPWPWIAVVCLTMWIVTLAAWWRDRQKRKRVGSAVAKKDDAKFESERQAIQGVRAACLEQSAEKTRAALLQWASIKQEGGPCRSLGMVAHIMNQPVQDATEISAAIWNLDRTLYTTSAERQTWDGRQFWETVKPAMTAKPPTAHKQENVLPPLYLH
ncbi:MAG: BatD family protein [Nitrospirota bacterium]|nr:BatD family protein [Nitrospirota bacterium]